MTIRLDPRERRPLMKCQHPKTTTLYAQRRDGDKRAFKPEGRKCDSCGAVLPVVNQDDGDKKV